MTPCPSFGAGDFNYNLGKSPQPEPAGRFIVSGYLRFPRLELGGATKRSPSQTGWMQSESLNTPNECGSRRVLLLSAGRAEGQETLPRLFCFCRFSPVNLPVTSQTNPVFLLQTVLYLNHAFQFPANHTFLALPVRQNPF